jgi:predicted HAD superfamily Cof-like phosphohydrolase
VSARVLNVDFQTRRLVSAEDSARQDKEEKLLLLLTDERPNPELITEFLDSFEVPRDADSVALYQTLIREEAKEVREAAAHLLKELTDLEYVVEAHRQVGGDQREVAPIIKSIIDEPTLYGLLDAFSPEVERAAQLRVHYSNMSKLGDDGRPVRRESDNKVLKGPNYKPCELEDLLS